jgi:RnfABCDGE-type electron transport complex B subunit
MEKAIWVIVVLSAVGVVFGLVLAIANKKFAMEVNPLIEEVEDILPKGQCGACGFAGCAKYAEAVVEDPTVPPNLCVPGKAPVAEKVAELTGKKAEATEQRYAHVKCRGSVGKAVLSFDYKGVEECNAVKLIQGGPKVCKFGCLGFGTCVTACNFHALSMGPEGLPAVDKDFCTGCGACANACPQKIIDLIPVNAKVAVHCNSNDKGGDARKACSQACLGCGICMRNCGYNAIKIVNNLAVVDSHICQTECSDPTCFAKCPTKAIQSLICAGNCSACGEEKAV